MLGRGGTFTMYSGEEGSRPALLLAWNMAPSSCALSMPLDPASLLNFDSANKLEMFTESSIPAPDSAFMYSYRRRVEVKIEKMLY